MMTLDQLNLCTPEGFVATVGFTFEHSPWIAEEAAKGRPFASLDALHARMVEVVAGSTEEKRIALIAAHPDLAARVAREGRLSASSRSEQVSAGLDKLTSEEIERFERLNSEYRARFGFPFVVCAREHDKASILSEIERRTKSDRQAEIVTALAEIAKIARLRLADAIAH
jgi:2-oxo-4-hydroxy-4-carboxy-5-ureidoimidazoline decarboxylase